MNEYTGGFVSKKEGTFELPRTSVELDIILLDILPSPNSFS